MNFLSKWYSSPQLKLHGIVSILGEEVKIEEQAALTEIVSTLLWFSYREGFAPITLSSGYISDGGWGCMLRTGQMVVAQSLLKQYFGKTASQWKNLEKSYSRQMYSQIISYFNDTADAPFSLHNIAIIGEKELKKPIGQWFGPSTIGFVLKEIAERQANFPLDIFLAPHSVLFQNEVIRSCTRRGAWRPVLLLIPTRLGVNKVNPIYFETLKIYMKLKQSVGILGGAPNSSYYFYAIQGDTLFYLDPHTVQPFACIDEKSTAEDISSYFAQSLSTMNLSAIDESLSFGFYCETELDFKDLVENIDYLNTQESFNGLFSVERETNEATYSLVRSFSMDDSFSTSTLFSPFLKSACDELKPVYKPLDCNGSNSQPTNCNNSDRPAKLDDDFETMSFVLMGSDCANEEVEISTTIRKRNCNEHADDFDDEGNVFNLSSALDNYF